jgi:hypothetical protein
MVATFDILCWVANLDGRMCRQIGQPKHPGLLGNLPDDRISNSVERFEELK